MRGCNAGAISWLVPPFSFVMRRFTVHHRLHHKMEDGWHGDKGRLDYTKKFCGISCAIPNGPMPMVFVRAMSPCHLCK